MSVSAAGFGRAAKKRQMVTSSTARPCGHAATEVVTVPATVTDGCPQWSVARQVATRSGTGGPSMCAVPSPVPPWYGMRVSAVPWTWMTETGAGSGHEPSSVAESGPMAAKAFVSQASR
jgi:hypothetical protein